MAPFFYQRQVKSLLYGITLTSASFSFLYFQRASCSYWVHQNNPVSLLQGLLISNFNSICNFNSLFHVRYHVTNSWDQGGEIFGRGHYSTYPKFPYGILDLDLVLLVLETHKERVREAMVSKELTSYPRSKMISWQCWVQYRPVGQELGSWGWLTSSKKCSSSHDQGRLGHQSPGKPSKHKHTAIHHCHLEEIG